MKEIEGNKIKVRIFTETEGGALSNSINLWLQDKNHKSLIIDIQYITIPMGYEHIRYCAFITYKEIVD